MNIKSMLVRLQSAMGRSDLIEQMVLLPGQAKRLNSEQPSKSVKIVVGYNRSSSSQTALDVTLWIAHQTRLATKAQVTVHIVYVVDDNYSNRQNIFNSIPVDNSTQYPLMSEAGAILGTTTPVLTQLRQVDTHPRVTSVDPCCFRAMFYHSQFEQAEQILWQARCLADEWGGTFTAHLRFGDVCTELRSVVESEAAAILFLGCTSNNHPLVQKLGNDFPCPVLGIPSTPD